VDISSGMLDEARKAAKKAGVQVEWLHADATKFESNNRFDSAICLCEGAFGLLGKDGDPFEHGLSILRNINKVLEPTARVIFTVLNGLAFIRRFKQEDVEKGRFDPTTMAEVCPMEYDTSQGKKNIMLRERGFVPTELVMMFRQTGFEVQNIWGGTAGKWGRRQIELDEMEIMVTASKASTI
jgi:SAM-dependent methyltransferase